MSAAVVTDRSEDLTALLSELQTYENLVCQPLNVNNDREIKNRIQHVIITYINKPEYWAAVLVALMVIKLRINPTNVPSTSETSGKPMPIFWADVVPGVVAAVSLPLSAKSDNPLPDLIASKAIDALATINAAQFEKPAIDATQLAAFAATFEKCLEFSHWAPSTHALGTHILVYSFTSRLDAMTLLTPPGFRILMRSIAEPVCDSAIPERQVVEMRVRAVTAVQCLCNNSRASVVSPLFKDGVALKTLWPIVESVKTIAQWPNDYTVIPESTPKQFFPLDLRNDLGFEASIAYILVHQHNNKPHQSESRFKVALKRVADPIILKCSGSRARRALQAIYDVSHMDDKSRLWDIPTPDQVAFFSELRTLLKANQSTSAAADSAQGSILFFGWNIASSYATDDDAGLLRVTGVAEEAEENVADALAMYNSLSFQSTTKDLLPDWIRIITFAARRDPKYREAINNTMQIHAGLLGMAKAQAAKPASKGWTGCDLWCHMLDFFCLSDIESTWALRELADPYMATSLHRAQGQYKANLVAEWIKFLQQSGNAVTEGSILAEGLSVRHHSPLLHVANHDIDCLSMQELLRAVSYCVSQRLPIQEDAFVTIINAIAAAHFRWTVEQWRVFLSQNDVLQAFLECANEISDGVSQYIIPFITKVVTIPGPRSPTEIANVLFLFHGALKLVEKDMAGVPGLASGIADEVRVLYTCFRGDFDLLTAAKKDTALTSTALEISKTLIMMDVSATHSLLICSMFHADLGTLDQLKQVLPRNLTKKIVAATVSGQDPNTTDTIMQLRPKFAKDLSETSHRMRCDVCHRSAEEAMKAKMGKCGKCQKVRYCSVSCQRRDWPEHKIVCK